MDGFERRSKKYEVGKEYMIAIFIDKESELWGSLTWHLSSHS